MNPDLNSRVAKTRELYVPDLYKLSPNQVISILIEYRTLIDNLAAALVSSEEARLKAEQTAQNLQKSCDFYRDKLLGMPPSHYPPIYPRPGQCLVCGQFHGSPNIPCPYMAATSNAKDQTP